MALIKSVDSSYFTVYISKSTKTYSFVFVLFWRFSTSEERYILILILTQVFLGGGFCISIRRPPELSFVSSQSLFLIHKIVWYVLFPNQLFGRFTKQAISFSFYFYFCLILIFIHMVYFYFYSWMTKIYGKLDQDDDFSFCGNCWRLIWPHF